MCIISKTFFDADSKAMNHLAEWAATPPICLVGRQRREDIANKPIAGTHKESDRAEGLLLKRQEGAGHTPTAVCRSPDRHL
jgi:hypothetical protein